MVRPRGAKKSDGFTHIWKCNRVSHNIMGYRVQSSHPDVTFSRIYKWVVWFLPNNGFVGVFVCGRYYRRVPTCFSTRNPRGNCLYKRYAQSFKQRLANKQNRLQSTVHDDFIASHFRAVLRSFKTSWVKSETFNGEFQRKSVQFTSHPGHHMHLYKPSIWRKMAHVHTYVYLWPYDCVLDWFWQCHCTLRHRSSIVL